MTSVKNAIHVTNLKLLGAIAALASLMALVSQYHLCFVWFHQPVMPESVRMMKK